MEYALRSKRAKFNTQFLKTEHFSVGDLQLLDVP